MEAVLRSLAEVAWGVACDELCARGAVAASEAAIRGELNGAALAVATDAREETARREQRRRRRERKLARLHAVRDDEEARLGLDLPRPETAEFARRRWAAQLARRGSSPGCDVRCAAAADRADLRGGMDTLAADPVLCQPRSVASSARALSRADWDLWLAREVPPQYKQPPHGVPLY